MKKAVIYSRVSGNRQDFERQVKDLEKYAKVHEYEILEVFADKVTGSTKAQERKAAKAFFEYIESNKVDIVLVSEISRIGRTAIDVQNNIDTIVNQLGINMYIDQQGLTAYEKSGKPSTIFKMITDVLANVAQMEKEQLVFRIKSGLENAKRKGIKLGRKKGATKDVEQFLSENRKVVRELKNKTSIRNTAKICECSPSNVQKVKSILKERGEI